MDNNKNNRGFIPIYHSFSGMINMAGRTDGEISIIELKVPLVTQMEYFLSSNKIRDAKKLQGFEVASCIDQLSDTGISMVRKKEILSVFALSHDTSIYRFLEGFHAQQSEGELRNWASMALMECRISIESELLDEKRIYISTGLGGRDNKLRYYVVMVAESKEPFLQYQKEMIEREMPFGLEAVGCEVERIVMHDIYFEMLALAPVNIDIRKPLKDVLDECNRYGNFISSQITITNIRELTEAEILDLIHRKAMPQELTLAMDFNLAEEEDDGEQYYTGDEDEDDEDEDDEDYEDDEEDDGEYDEDDNA
ncbi:MAG: hypothetical protein LBD28_01290 [Tannerellaceae bacterium]|jgi:hypothetical protein|nr:hypothetical protein [Tannerellaceae bacterium]